MRFGVREHTRKDANGNDVKVSQHTKNGRGARPRKRKNLARRGWGNVVRAWRAGRRKKKLLCAAFALLATVEISAYVVLQTSAFALVTLAAVAAAIALLANVAAGGKGTNR